MKLTAGAPLPLIMSALARAGWADLDTGAAQGVRSVLRALCDLLPHGSATGNVTTSQIADAAGLSGRWTADRLRVLEAMELITWTRGQIIAGRPTPGLIRVNKKRLVDLIRRARHAIDDRTRARAAETSARIRDTLRNWTQLNRPKPAAAPIVETRVQRNPLSVHVELSSTLPPQGEETTSLRPVDPPPLGTRTAALRARMRDRGIQPPGLPR